MGMPFVCIFRAHVSPFELNDKSKDISRNCSLLRRVPKLAVTSRTRKTDSEIKIPVEFLGLDTDAYKRPFGSVDLMYRYVCSSRFFNDASYVRGELKANDRKRMTQRELYRAFVDWLPGNAHLVGQQKEKNAQFSRDDVLEESLNRFGKREEYEKRVEGWRQERKELLAKQMGRQKRKADAAEAEEYAAAWMGWLERNA